MERYAGRPDQHRSRGTRLLILVTALALAVAGLVAANLTSSASAERTAVAVDGYQVPAPPPSRTYSTLAPAFVPPPQAPSTTSPTTIAPPVTTTAPPPDTTPPTAPAAPTTTAPAVRQAVRAASTNPPGSAAEATPATATAAPTGYGCAAAIAYLQTHAAPGFTFECPGNALGHQAMTCAFVAGVCPGTRIIAIADPCPAAYMNEAYNSRVAEGLAAGPFDPYGYCRN